MPHGAKVENATPPGHGDSPADKNGKYTHNRVGDESAKLEVGHVEIHGMGKKLLPCKSVHMCDNTAVDT